MLSGLPAWVACDFALQLGRDLPVLRLEFVPVRCYLGSCFRGPGDLSGAARILTSHFNELVRLRDEKLDKMIKVKLIKEIQKSKSETGSLAFSAEPKINEDFQARYPLPHYQAKLLWKIFTHYQFSAWPESREKAAKLIDNFHKQLGFSPEELFASHPN